MFETNTPATWNPWILKLPRLSPVFQLHAGAKTTWCLGKNYALKHPKNSKWDSIFLMLPPSQTCLKQTKPEVSLDV